MVEPTALALRVPLEQFESPSPALFLIRILFELAIDRMPSSVQKRARYASVVRIDVVSCTSFRATTCNATFNFHRIFASVIGIRSKELIDEMRPCFKPKN